MRAKHASDHASGTPPVRSPPASQIFVEVTGRNPFGLGIALSVEVTRSMIGSNSTTQLNTQKHKQTKKTPNHPSERNRHATLKTRASGMWVAFKIRCLLSYINVHSLVCPVYFHVFAIRRHRGGSPKTPVWRYENAMFALGKINKLYFKFSHVTTKRTQG